jgi:hypothetical protein
MKTALALLALATTLPAVQHLRWATRHVREIAPGCGDRKNGCAWAEIAYVEVVSGRESLRAQINSAIRGCSGESEKKSPLHEVHSFISGYQRERKESPEHLQRWFMSEASEVLLSTPTVFSVRCWSQEYVGGAHPNTNMRYINLDPATGEELELADVLRGDFLPRLNEIAEIYFRRVRELSPTESLSEAGFQMEPFGVTDNFALGPKGLIFTWNAYEIAAHAMGATTIEIPYSKIRALLKPSFAP